MEVLIIPMLAILNRFRGGGIISGVPARLFIASLLLGLIVGCYVGIAYGIKFAPSVFFACFAGFFISDVTGTGDGLTAIHGRYDGVRKYSIFNRWMYAIADRFAVTGTKNWGFWYMTCRGVYAMPLIAGVAISLGKYECLPLALLALTQGACYRLQGYFPEHRFSVAIAELLNAGVLGVALFFVLRGS